jgi:mannan endo-1,4-beta-mannosidase
MASREHIFEVWVVNPLITPFKATKRQDDVGVGSSFDGSQGVDSEDINNIPQVSFNSFQLFPDQNIYSPVDTSLPAFNQSLQAGLDWIRRQGDIARM